MLENKSLIYGLGTAEHLIKVGHDQGIAPVVDLLRSPEESVQQVVVIPRISIGDS